MPAPIRRSGVLTFLSALLLISIGGAAIPSLIGSTLLLTLLTQATIDAILASGVGFMMRQNGLVSFGHAAFFGMAGYTVALMVAHRVGPVELAVVAAIALPSLFAFLLGLAILRLSGTAFSMLTLAVAQALYQLVLKWRALANGDDGIQVNLPDHLFGVDVAVFQQPASMFLICWAMLMLLLLGLWLLSRSAFGTLTVAIRENEERARFIGYQTMLPRALIYAISAAIGALGGVLFALYNGFISPDALYWSLSGEALVMAVIGGTRNIWGPALGAVIFFLLKDAAGDLTEHWQAIIGGALIVVTVLLPGGVSGALVAAVGRLQKRSSGM